MLVKSLTEQIGAIEPPMARFWLSYMEIVEILYQHYHAMETQNWDKHWASICKMLPWMAAYGSLHYTKYLSVLSEINNFYDKKRFERITKNSH